MGLWRGGLEAGSLAKNGYVSININGTMYLAHRLAWFHYYGEWPADQLDHKNRVRSDNRIGNLRPANNRSNHENRTNNKSGHAGVIWDKARQKWKAYARVDYVMCNIGRYGTIEEAVEARRTFLEKQCS